LLATSWPLYVVGFEGDLPNLFCHINNCYPNSASNKQKKRKKTKRKSKEKKKTKVGKVRFELKTLGIELEA